MSSPTPAKFERFFWGGGQDGEAYYIKHLTFLIPPVIAPLKSILTSAVDDIPFNAEDGRPFTIAEYGCLDGGCSAPLFQHLIEYVRQKYKPAPDFHIMYEDQPYDDFKSLFLMANALTGIAYESAWSQQEGVYFSAVGRSFYEQCFPRDSVHLGFCSHAAIYLSKRPCLLPDVPIHALANDDRTKALFEEQAATDWETFLLNRCRELVPGGRLFLNDFYTTEDGYFVGYPKGAKNFYRTMHTIWKQLYDEGKLTKEELEEPTYNHYARTVEEFKAPFLNKDSAVYREGFRLVSLETKVIPCGFQEELKKNDLNDPAVVAELAHGFVMAMRTWSSGDFLGALSSRPEMERKEIVDELYQRWEDQVRAEPTCHKVDMPLAYIMLRKISH